MAEEGAGPNCGHRGYPGLVAGADLTAAAKQYCAVKFDVGGGATHGQAILSTAGAAPIGVLENAPNTNEGVSLYPLDGGIYWMMVDGAAGDILPGSFLKSDGNGMGVVTTTPDDFVFARSVAKTTIAVKRRIPVQLFTPHRY